MVATASVANGRHWGCIALNVSVIGLCATGRVKRRKFTALRLLNDRLTAGHRVEVWRALRVLCLLSSFFRSEGIEDVI